MKRRSKATPAVLTILILAVLLSLILFFIRPRVNFVVTSADERLMETYVEKRFFKPYRIVVTVYPETADTAYSIYSPLAALSTIRDDVKPGNISACFSITDTAAREYFDLVFYPNESVMWTLAYENAPENTAKVYNANDTEEIELALFAEDLPSFSYENSLNSVTLENLVGNLESNNIETLIIFSPEKTGGLIRNTSFSFIIDRLYTKALENGQSFVSVGEDFDAMIDVLTHSVETGEQGSIIEIDYAMF